MLRGVGRSVGALALCWAEAAEAAPDISASLAMLPQDAGDESPACLDGSPFGAYLRKSATNSTKWTAYIQGGGWCYHEAECAQRALTGLGSSKNWPGQAECRCMNAMEDGSLDGDCNCVVLPYCDGASFTGFRPKPWPAPGGAPGLYFRGIKNLDAAMDFAFAAGLGGATEFVLTGESAGGLATFLHADRVAAQVSQRAPGCQHIVAAPNVGFFLDHDDYAHDEKNYTAYMKYVYGMQNLTFGPDGGLHPACGAAFPESQHYCFMSPHMQRFVQTPLFVLNSKYDDWQIAEELHTRAAAAVETYGADFMEAFRPMLENPRKNGAAITSCVCHGCDFGHLQVDGQSALRWYAEWYLGKTQGAASFHVDPRGPNGDGALRAPLCKGLEGAAGGLEVHV